MQRSPGRCAFRARLRCPRHRNSDSARRACSRDCLQRTVFALDSKSAAPRRFDRHNHRSAGCLQRSSGHRFGRRTRIMAAQAFRRDRRRRLNCRVFPRIGGLFAAGSGICAWLRLMWPGGLRIRWRAPGSGCEGSPPKPALVALSFIKG